ncbi:hypothetical protein CP10139811_1018 [Chlamydia ibidis]|uniref:Uncharacterized protein n=1 Tax=Chlamydia ibidis TaxID=1405396 RepID=S7KGS5_9CHLA|nr:hypothetical protein CP10139811_1018 [Chlamydia ibidis]
MLKSFSLRVPKSLRKSGLLNMIFLEKVKRLFLDICIVVIYRKEFLENCKGWSLCD